ncbi:MAG: hypothetical protein OEX97_05085 [Acidimicrobiia bacterium]|nr:hypothetical protein [Acidimicrobiia bacterium]
MPLAWVVELRPEDRSVLVDVGIVELKGDSRFCLRFGDRHAVEPEFLDDLAEIVEHYQVSVERDKARLITAPGVRQLVFKGAGDHFGCLLVFEVSFARELAGDQQVLLECRAIFAGVDLDVREQPTLRGNRIVECELDNEVVSRVPIFSEADYRAVFGHQQRRLSDYLDSKRRVALSRRAERDHQYERQEGHEHPPAHG